MQETKTRKAINFDLSIKALKEFYLKHHTKAYDDIYNFMKDNGFKHRQGSGYISVKHIDNEYIRKIIEKMKKEFPWLKDCVKEIDVTDIGKQYSLKALLEEKDNIEISLKKTTNSKEYFINKLKDFTTKKKDDEDIER